MKNQSKFLKLIKKIRDAKNSAFTLLSLISNSGDHCSLSELAQYQKKKRQSWETKFLSNYDVSEIKKKLEKDLLLKFEKEIEKLHEVRFNYELLKYSKEINGTRIKLESYVHRRKEKNADLLSGWSEFINFGIRTYVNPLINSTITTDSFLISPDYKIPTVGWDDCIKTYKVGLEREYLELKGTVAIFNDLYTYTKKIPAFFAKDMTILQLFSYFGLDDFIETCVIYGADISYKEPISGKTALDFYTPMQNLDINKKAYIVSLLDGTYDNGKYKIEYEKRTLEKYIPKKENNLDMKNEGSFISLTSSTNNSGQISEKLGAARVRKI